MILLILIYSSELRSKTMMSTTLSARNSMQRKETLSVPPNMINKGTIRWAQNPHLLWSQTGSKNHSSMPSLIRHQVNSTKMVEIWLVFRIWPRVQLTRRRHQWCKLTMKMLPSRKCNTLTRLLHPYLVRAALLVLNNSVSPWRSRRKSSKWQLQNLVKEASLVLRRKWMRSVFLRRDQH